MTTLYLHGFLSSPESKKGKVLRATHEAAGIPFIAPDLTTGPAKAAALIREIASGIPAGDLTVVGSSLGGFYAAWLAEQTGCRAVLLNPAVTPWSFIGDYLGVQQVTGSERTILITPEYAEELKALYCPEVTFPDRYLVLLSTADEVLDWRESERKYAETRRIMIPGGDHQIADFVRYAPEVMAFCENRTV